MTAPDADQHATARAYDPAAPGDADWSAVRELLVRSHAGSPVAWNWDVRRWDGWRFHREEGRLPAALSDGIGLWEDDAGRLVGAVHGEDGGDAFLELDPDWRHLQPAMLAWAEARLAAPAPATPARAVSAPAAPARGGGAVLEVPAWDYDLPLRTLLRERGYEERASDGCVRRLRFGAWRLPRPEVAAPYALRTTAPATLDEDAAQMAALLNAAFGRSVHTAAEYRRFATASPSFRHDLNLVAVAPDGSFGAHVGLTYDEPNRHGIIEPVCTHPDHRRHGLAQALLLEGLARLHDLGAATCDVGTGDMGPANALYRSMPFSEEYHGARWRLEIGGQ